MTNSKSKKLLIVDDDPSLQILYQAEFQLAGYEVVMAASGPEALSMLKEEKPALVVLDVNMPGMNGIETMMQLLALNNQIPIIINTSFADYKENYLTWAADEFVVKSSNVDELKDRVDRLLISHGVALDASSLLGSTF